MDAELKLGPSGSATRKPLSGALRVALVHDWLTGMRGGEKCLQVLCEAFPNAPLHTLLHRPGALSPAIESMDIRTSVLQRIPRVADHYRKLLPVMPAAARTWRIENVDLVVSLSHCVAKAARVPKGTPHVCYCFTPMRYAWDGLDQYLESWSDRPIRKLAAKLVLGRLRAWDRATASHVTHFVAISETVRSRIRRCYGRDSVVIHPPADTEFYTPVDRPREDFYLCVSALVPYKKVEHAVLACSRLGKNLVVIGDGPERRRIEGLAGPTVHFLGGPSDEVLRDHYRRCRALLFPGEEDFGIVPVEAMACGAPVIALRRGGAAETVVPGAGVFHDRPGEAAVEEAITHWERVGRPHDPRVARRRAEEFSPSIFRRRLLGYLRNVAESSRNGSAIPAPHAFRLGEPS